MKPGQRCCALIGAALLVCVSTVPQARAQAPTPRAAVQDFLRRFSFSAPPATVTSVVAGGSTVNAALNAWLATQDNWSALDDSAAELETLPTALSNGGYPDYNIFERAIYQHMILTPRQLQAKMELHWLDHFAVGLQSVGDPAVMYHYDQTIRANALGNFATLLNAVSQEGAMLIWLSNNFNAGAVPNENFAREVMQLYSFGTQQLNDDGSVVMSTGTPPVPLATYNQKDVVGLAQAMTGYGLVFDSSNNNPQTRFSVQYFPGNHYSGAIKYFGRVQPVPNSGDPNTGAIPFVIDQLARARSTAPFEVKELLQRFVTENPPPQYISDIVQVWRKAEKAPDQIAQVINAIVNHPLFAKYYNNMPKQPAEMMFGALRQMPGVMQATQNVTPGSSLLYELSSLGQQLFYPPTVFSFYRPGSLDTLTNTQTVLQRTGVFANFTNAQPGGTYTDTYIDLSQINTLAGVPPTAKYPGPYIANYLLDATVDGGSTGMQGIIHGFLGKTPDNNQILGAIWLLLNSPDYTVN